MHVDLTVYDPLTNVVLLLGWILNNAAWNILEQTMLAALPFVVLVVREWYEARREGDDEGNKGMLSLNRIETRLYAMLLIYLFCAAPIMSVTFAPVKVDEAHRFACSVRVADNTTSMPIGGSIGGTSPNIPVWWAAVHAVSRGITNTMISALPCQTDYQYISTQINNTAIQDPILKREVARFQQVCYGAARTKLYNLSDGLSAARARDVDWIGSSYFLTTPGYYGSFSANKPVNGFPYDPANDFGRGTTSAQGGYPTCYDWWTADDIGLKDRLHDQIDDDLWDNIAGAFSSASSEEYAIRGLLHANVISGAAGAGGANAGGGGDGGGAIGNFLGSIAGGVGVALATIAAEGVASVMTLALPMVQHFMLMAIVIALPFILVISGYSFKVVGIVTFSYFGISTMSFWFQLSRWLNNEMIGLLYDSGVIMFTLTSDMGNLYDQAVLNIVQTTMLIIFPAFWMAMLGWSGNAIGGGIDAALKGGSKDAGDAGKKGGDVTTNTVKNAGKP